jgi:tetratricopeptide (TPR) repeat protein
LRRYVEAQRGFTDGLLVNPQAHLFSLATAAIDLKKNGDTAPLRAALNKIPRDFDPGGAVTTVALRLSLMTRNYVEAARLLDVSTHKELNDGGVGGTAATLDGYTFPKSWYQGLVARGQGDMERARRAFETARGLVEADPRQCLDDAKTNSMLGLIDAALARKEAALREGRRAVELLPVSKDAYDGPVVATNLAVIYAQVGERDLALQQLAELVALPNGPTSGTLGVEPEWDPLRGDPRFEKLLTL